MITWPFGNLDRGAYDVIVADPPWTFKTRSPKGITKKGAGGQYALMSLAEIEMLPVDLLAKRDCVLLLWTTGWAMAEGFAHQVARRWGFRPCSEIVWLKRTKNDKSRIGTGYRVRSMHEPVLLCTMGAPRHKAFPSAFDGLAREHSRKPDEFYEIVGMATPNARRADLFAREAHPGFEAFGDEIGKFKEVS